MIRSSFWCFVILTSPTQGLSQQLCHPKGCLSTRDCSPSPHSHSRWKKLPPMAGREAVHGVVGLFPTIS